MTPAPDVPAQRAALHRLDAVERQKSALFAAEARAAAHVGVVFGDEGPGVILEVVNRPAFQARIDAANAATNGSWDDGPPPF